MIVGVVAAIVMAVAVDDPGDSSVSATGLLEDDPVSGEPLQSELVSDPDRTSPVSTLVVAPLTSQPGDLGSEVTGAAGTDLSPSVPLAPSLLQPGTTLTGETTSTGLPAETTPAALSTQPPVTPSSPVSAGRPETTSVPSTQAPTSPAPTTRPPTSPAPASGRVVWQDHFDRLDTSVWTPEHSTYGDGNYELQCYRPENVQVADSKLILHARHETYTCPNGSVRRVTSGMIRSRGVTFGPGQAIEFQVKLNPANPNDQGGLWPAVWSSGWAGGWPQGGELDYLEVMTAEDPRRAMFSLHYANRSNRHGHQNRGAILDRNFSEDWHVIRFEYGRNGNLVWFLDGRETFRVTDAETLQGYPAPFNQATGEIKINLALGGRPGPLSWAALGDTGATFEVDWIRIVEL